MTMESSHSATSSKATTATTITTKASVSTPPLSTLLGPAVAVTLLLRDYETYSLTERVSYHFHLTGSLGCDRRHEKHATTAPAGGGAEARHEKKLLRPHPHHQRSASRESIPEQYTIDHSNPTNQTKKKLKKKVRVCGVAKILECIPSNPRLSRKERAALRSGIARIHRASARAAQTQGHNTTSTTTTTTPAGEDHPKEGGEGASSSTTSITPDVICFEPPMLPLRVNPTSRFFFAYETTRLAFCIDASPTLTSTLGFATTDDACCPLDVLPNMAKTFFTALAESIPLLQPSATTWQPVVAVTVLAVYPRVPPQHHDYVGGSGEDEEMPAATLLVRDYRVHDLESVQKLIQHIATWALSEMESAISRRNLAFGGPLRGQDGVTTSSTTSSPPSSCSTSLLRDLVDAGHAALSTMSSMARPILVLATDCRAVACGGGMLEAVQGGAAHASSTQLGVVPIVVLDLSSRVDATQQQQRQVALTSSDSFPYQTITTSSFINEDPGRTLFPLQWADNAEELFGICRATDGCFFDGHLLELAAKTKAGQVLPDVVGASQQRAQPNASSPLAADPLFSFRRHSMHPNAVQWYTLFELSPLTPTHSAVFGKLPPPAYLRQRIAMRGVVSEATPQPLLPLPRPGSLTTSMMTETDRSTHSPAVASKPFSALFSNYNISPIRILSLLLMRVREGYWTKQYGTSNNEPDKVSILLCLSLELGTVLHYKISYRALPGPHQQMHERGSGDRVIPHVLYQVGSANIKIELSGPAAFVKRVKNDYLRAVANPTNVAVVNNGRTPQSLSVSVAQQVSMRLCHLMRWIRKEDELQAEVSPLRWTNQLSEPDTDFVRRLGSLTWQQTCRHFRCDQFDCICTGRMPYDFYDATGGHVDDAFAAANANDDGREQLEEALSQWATQTVEIAPHAREGGSRNRYVRRIESATASSSSNDALTIYCMVELIPSTIASRLFTVTVETFGGIEANHRLLLVDSVKAIIGDLADVRVLDMQFGPYLLPPPDQRHQPGGKPCFLESQHTHEFWELVDHPELLPLLMKRRTEIGKYLLMESTSNYALFAKLEVELPCNSNSDVEETSALDDTDDPGDLVQYHISILPDRAVVHFHMECERGLFYPYRRVPGRKFPNKAARLKKRDQECGRALRSRTNLLRAFGSKARDGLETLPLAAFEHKETPVESVRRLINYASRVSLRLRFFHPGTGTADSVLHSLTMEAILSGTCGPEIAKLSIGEGEKVQEKAIGEWFVVQYDEGDNMSIGFLSLETTCEVDELDGRSLSYRELTLYTISVPDLYTRREDIADDVGIEEYMCVTEFTENISVAHNKLYSLAAYTALKPGAQPPVSTIHLDDLIEVMRCIEFVEVANVNIARGSPKLTEIMGTVVHQIPCEFSDLHFFYVEDSDKNAFLKTHDEDDDFSRESMLLDTGVEYVDDDERTRTSDDGTTTVNTEGPNGTLEEVDNIVEEAKVSPRSIIPAPIFVRFLLDGQPATTADLASADNSSTVGVLVSVMKLKDVNRSTPRVVNPRGLPKSHFAAGAQLSGLLNAFVAEETLERLRIQGNAIEFLDLQLARMCLRRARGVRTDKVELFFYVAKADSMVPASASGSGDTDVEEGFRIFEEEFAAYSWLYVKSTSPGGYMVIDVDDFGSLSYWCFVTVKKASGIVGLEVHHPMGPERASVVLSKVREAVQKCAHRANQILLLRRLHVSRSASALLVPEDAEFIGDNAVGEEMSNGEETGVKEGHGTLFGAGHFGCPVVFQHSFDLFHRCATSPDQVARTLESTVLHIFALSNRRRVFVYKDEAGSIFYMFLTASGGGLAADGKIDLLVHGVKEPGTSVALQLTRLLSKKLMSIAIDMLSSVLMKNPRYIWKQADLSYVTNFSHEWGKVQEEEYVDNSSQERRYVFPSSLRNPGLILLHFRQNLCGSTYFHPLLEVAPRDDRDLVGPAHGDLESVSFVFFYNNTPSKLNSLLQGRSTLSDKGTEYASKAGTGIAIIEVSLVDSDGNKCKYIQLKQSLDEIYDVLSVPLETIHFRKVTYDNEIDRSADGRLFVQVKVTDTVLRGDIIHDWVLLSLNQVLASWVTERCLEKQQPGLWNSCAPPVSDVATQENGRSQQIERLCPGLPALTSVLEATHDLPHPGIRRVQCLGVIRSSTVASVALRLVERNVLDQIKGDKSNKFPPSLHENTCIIRASRDAPLKRVQLSWDKDHRSAIVRDLFPSNSKQVTIQDKHIDCPEYLIFCRFPEDASGKHSLPKLFEEIAGGTGDESTVVSQLKLDNPSAFRQSFVFVFSVKRNRRVLYTYNWSPDLFSSVSERLQEENKKLLFSTQHSVRSLQRRSLGILLPTMTSVQGLPASKLPVYNIPAEKTSAHEAASNVQEAPRRRSSRRAIRPVSILKPRLIGKSVEGAAMHAVAASRSRATFKGSYGPPSATTGPSKTQHIPKASSDSLVARRPSQGRRNQEKVEDVATSKVRRKFRLNTLAEKTLMRAHSLHYEALRKMSASLWPLKPSQSIDAPVAEFLLSQTSAHWSDVSEVFAFRSTNLKDTAYSFGSALVGWVPGLRMVQQIPGTRNLKGHDDTVSQVLLMGKVKNVKGSRFAPVIRVSVTNAKLVYCQSWVLTFSRRSRIQSKSLGCCLHTHLEKEAAGADKISADLQTAIPLETMLFDFAASSVERAMRTTGGERAASLSAEALHLAKALAHRYDLMKQRRLLNSRYKVICAPLILSSYRNELINFTTGEELFSWLLENAENRGLYKCSGDGLCFRRDIVVNGTRSVCFLALDKDDPVHKLEITIVCKTHGRDIYEFMFRKNSCVAVTVAKGIAIEGAGLVFEELKIAATCLYRKALWGRISGSSTPSNPSAFSPENDISQLLALCVTRPISRYIATNMDNHRLGVVFGRGMEVDWRQCYHEMSRDSAFSPSWTVGENTDEVPFRRLLYLASEDLFLLVSTSADGFQTEINVVDQEDMAPEGRHRMAAQKFVNYVLHYIWQSLD